MEEGAALCAICLQEKPDCAPPCGRTDELQFHLHCLALLRRVQHPHALRCPHCNLECPAGEQAPLEEEEATAAAVRGLVRLLLEVWLATDGFWTKPGVYLQVKNSLMQGDEEAGVQAAIAGEVSCMMEGAIGAAVTRTSLHSLHTFRCRGQEGETAICVRRTAVVGQCGAVLVDGFTLCAQRFRGSLRSARPDSHMSPLRF